MAEYIEREALEKALTAAAVNDKDKNRRTWATAICILHDLPAADVAPVVHGRWENGNPICPVCGENKFKDLDADIWCDWLPQYCPNCGARMDGDDDAEAD